MKLTKPMVGLAALAPAAWLIRKYRSEQVANAPAEATLLKLAGKPLFKWAADRALLGRYLDRNAPSRGRLTRDDVARILEQTWRNYDELAPGARVERLKTLGNRQNVLHEVVRQADGGGAMKTPMSGYSTVLSPPAPSRSWPMSHARPPSG